MVKKLEQEYKKRSRVRWGMMCLKIGGVEGRLVDNSVGIPEKKEGGRDDDWRE